MSYSNDQKRGIAWALMGLSPGASRADVLKKYKRFALELHPNKNPGNPRAFEAFQYMTGAKDALLEEMSGKYPWRQFAAPPPGWTYSSPSPSPRASPSPSRSSTPSRSPSPPRSTSRKSSFSRQSSFSRRSSSPPWSSSPPRSSSFSRSSSPYGFSGSSVPHARESVGSRPSRSPSRRFSRQSSGRSGSSAYSTAYGFSGPSVPHARGEWVGRRSPTADPMDWS